MKREGSMVKVLFNLPLDLLVDLDAYAKKHKYTRAECLRHAIRVVVYGQDEKEND